MTLDEELTVQEIADLLGLHRTTVSRMLERGELAGQTLKDLLSYQYQKGWSDCIEELYAHMKSVRPVRSRTRKPDAGSKDALQADSDKPHPEKRERSDTSHEEEVIKKFKEYIAFRYDWVLGDPDEGGRYPTVDSDGDVRLWFTIEEMEEAMKK